MPYFSNPEIISNETNIKAIRKILEVVDEITIVRVLGGEPFLHPKLRDFIHFLVCSEKILNVQVVTNGTIAPKEELIESLKSEKVKIRISDYGEHSKKIKEIGRLMSDNGVSYEIRSNDDKWVCMGDLRKRNRSKRELKNQYRICGMPCNSLLKGRLHKCPRSSSGMEIGAIPIIEDDYIDILETDTKELKNRMRDFIYRRPTYLTACNYCDKGTRAEKAVTPGVQKSNEQNK